MATYNFTVRAKDESGAYSDRDFGIQIKNNVIDRMLLIGATSAYASVDGKSFTTRTGKGGIFADCWLDRWVVFKNNSTYSYSPDTINWFEENKLNVIDTTNNDTEYACSIDINTIKRQTVELNGRLYMLLRVGSAVKIVQTTDLINWYVVKFSNAIEGKYFQKADFTSLTTFSDLKLDNGKIIFTDNLLNLYTFDPVDQTMTIIGSSYKSTAYSTVLFDKRNGVYFIGSYSSGLLHIMTSDDMLNFNELASITVGAAPSGSNYMAAMSYYNGAIIHHGMLTNIAIQTRPDESPIVATLTGTVSPIVVDTFKGSLYTINAGSTGNVLRRYDAINRNGSTPAARAVTLSEPIVSMALRK